MARILTALEGVTWKSPAISPALPVGNHTYTVEARAGSAIANPEGRSAPRTFVVDTEPPGLTLNQPTSLSNKNMPTFSGTSSETTTVTVAIYKAPSGPEVATVTAKPAGGLWKTEALSKPLADGQYTAIATQPSGIGNGSDTLRSRGTSSRGGR